MAETLQPDPAFTRALLRDVQALERILAEDRIETGVRRVGAEQELILVDDRRVVAPVAMDVLDTLDDARFTTELARFNVEVNVPPFEVSPTLFSELQAALDELVGRVQDAAREHGADIVLTGILPCLNQRDLSLDNMTPRDRYRRLNEATMALAEGRMLLHVTGTDELRVEHDSVMLEACNTSYQVHVQVEPDEFARFYNAAQLVTAPLLAASANSPFLFGKRLWAETRIAVFRQSIDTRAASPSLRELTPRVRFGDAWVERGVVELLEEDIVRFKTMMTKEPDEDPIEVLDAGGVPKLGCLQLHNSTIYRWNRPCYGITDGKPHLRIECRVLPSGPTVADEVANSAFWLGMMVGAADRYEDLTSRLEFGDVKANFFAAARRGLNTGFTWVDQETASAPRLIRDTLLPLAEEGLATLGVDPEEAKRYLTLIDRRVAEDMTGTRWLEKSAQAMRAAASRPERCAALTSAMISRQQSGRPVHEWRLARIEEGLGTTGPTVDQYMTTQLFTVHEDELVDLAAFIMDREKTRQILVEDEEFRLVGLISYRSLLRLLASGRIQELGGPVPVSEVMTRDPITVPPDTPVTEAIRLMRDHEVSCLPVVQDEQLVGILSERDFMPLASELLDSSFVPPD
ncbi:MAG: glutamate-cysteine ligase family protein [Longimicrobiales bacterium]|nr:glutamate-cysteine ligase family protein [Longimicrobiales bacterium]